MGLKGQETILHFHHLSSLEGLSSPKYNYFIHQHSDGKIWISSITGLNEFDGRKVQINVPDQNDSTSLVSPRASFSDIFESPTGDLWFTNVEAIIKYNPRNDNFERHYITDIKGDTILPEYIWMHLDVNNGQCFTYANEWIYTHNLFKNEPAKKILKKYFNYNTVVHKNDDNTYTFTHHNSNANFIDFYRYDQEVRQIIQKTTNYIPDESNINFIYSSKGYQILIATTTMLYKTNLPPKSTFTPLNINYNGKKISDIIDIEKIDKFHLLLATRSEGIYLYNNKDDFIISRLYMASYGSSKPFKEEINRTYLDPQNNLWISTESNGVWYTHLKKNKFIPFFLKENQVSSQVISISEGKSKEVFLLYPKKLLEVKENDDTIVYDIPLRGDGIEKPTFVFQDTNEGIWVGSLSKLLRKLPGNKKFTSFDVLPEKNGEEIGFNSVHEISPGKLIFAANQMSSILFENEESTWVTKEVVEPFFAKPINDFLFSATHKRELYIHPIDSLLGKADTVLELSAIATDIIPGKTKAIYFIPTFDGLYKLTQKNRSWYLQKDSKFPHLPVNSIHLDKKGYLWLASSRGLHRYHPENGSVWTFKESDGLQGPNFNFKSVLSHSDGRLFLGGSNGLNVFVPEAIEPTVPLPRPTITAVLINGTEDNLEQYNRSKYRNPQLITDIRLPFRDNNLKLHLSSMEYSDPESCQFKYRLLGSKRDTDWVDHGHNATLDFPNLSSGKFQLEFNASNSDGIWSKEPRKLNIQVDPPWYFSKWFLTLAGLFLLLIGFLVARRENKREREKEELKRKEAEAREKEEAAKRLAAETETAVLRLQMDPHFIYNAMNGVDDMIRQGKNEKASNYLYRISHLLRQILEQSEELNISLLEEKELLSLYLAAEQIRLGDKLQYKFFVEEDVDELEQEIPTMILQPFVENAVWHGIAPKHDGGIVNIRFSNHNGALIVEIKDNGVGRSRAPKHLKKKYESKAISITQRRFNLLQETVGKNNAGFKIIDLFDKEGTPAGTKVVLTFPK